MDVLAIVLVLVAAVAAAYVVGGPLRSGRFEAEDAAHEAQLADLETAKEARYREIREAEMDFRTGKLSEEDWKAIDRQLRTEAVELLRRLDALGAAEAQRVREGAGGTAAEQAPADPAATPAREPVDVPGER
jgi:site-specific DNA-cytosine methylase